MGRVGSGAGPGGQFGPTGQGLAAHGPYPRVVRLRPLGRKLFPHPDRLIEGRLGTLKPVRKVAMSRHAVSEITPKAKPEEELPEELGMLAGALVATDKVEDVLEKLAVPGGGR